MGERRDAALHERYGGEQSDGSGAARVTSSGVRPLVPSVGARLALGESIGAGLLGMSGIGESLMAWVGGFGQGGAYGAEWARAAGLDGLATAVGRLNPFPDVTALSSWSATFSPAATVVGEQVREWVRGMLPPLLLTGVADALAGLLPPNLRGVDLPWERLQELLLGEGLPLAWVPQQRLIERVLAAETAQARRAVYGRSHRQIVDDCEAVLDGCSSLLLSGDVEFAVKAVAGMRDGHHELAQAMTANLLDSVLQHAAPELTAVRKRREAARPDGDLPLSDYFLHCSVWACYRQFWPPQPVPSWFGRHPSAHAVSRRQYSRVNAVLGLAHLTGVLATLDVRFSRGRRVPST